MRKQDYISKKQALEMIKDHNTNDAKRNMGGRVINPLTLAMFGFKEKKVKK